MTKMKCGSPILVGLLPLNFCVVWLPVTYVKSLSLILLDFWEGQGWEGVGGVWFEFLSVKSIFGC